MNDPKVASITAGGAGMFCGSCMRDNAVAAHLIRRGVPITLIPLFTPIRTDEEDVSLDRVFLGGINVYLEQRWPALARLPGPIRRWLDHPALLRGLSKLALQTRRSEDGAVALSLLRGEDGRQAAEIRDLLDWLETDLRPDVVNLTNLLIAGFVPALKQRMGVPVVVTLQGDDIFLDSLEPDDRIRVIGEMRRIARHVDAFLTFSDDYARRMGELFEIPTERIRVVPLGLADPEDFAPARPRSSEGPPTVGYLARICPHKGFDRLVDAFLLLREREETASVRLRAAGWLGASDLPFFERQKQRIADAGAGDDFELVEIPERSGKIEFLRSLDVFSAPSPYLEPKGLFVLEALAAGVPVVQPNHGSYPEILGRTGGGLLVPPDDPEALADALGELLCAPVEKRRRLGEEGRRGVLEHHSEAAMADATLALWAELAASGHPPRDAPEPPESDR